MSRTWYKILLLTVSAVLAAPLMVHACAVCYVLPGKTVADHLVDSQRVVLARENPDQPFSYVAVEFLKGVATDDDYGLFVPSTTRRQLRTLPDHVVVLVRQNNTSAWRSLGIADPEYLAVLRRIIARSSEWTGDAGQRKRCEFFVSLFGHENRAIFELAYLEMGRAPYTIIRQMAPLVDRDDLHPMLQRREYYEWRPLAILLLAQNASDADRQLIEDSFHSCARFSIAANLAAWTTAYIELHGADAIAEIETMYLGDLRRTEEEIRAVVLALSVHGRCGSTAVRDQISTSYAFTLQNHPQIAPLIIENLADWGQWQYRDEVSRVLTRETLEFDPSEMETIQNYLTGRNQKVVRR